MWIHYFKTYIVNNGKFYLWMQVDYLQTFFLLILRIQVLPQIPRMHVGNTVNKCLLLHFKSRNAMNGARDTSDKVIMTPTY